MATGFPLGSFSRGRRDWAIETLWYASASSPGGALSPFAALFNNTQAPNRLALYGILAWRAYPPQTMIAFTTPTSHGGGIPVVGPLVPGIASIDGVFSIFNSTIPTSIESQILFVADGKSWLTNGDVPLFVIQPGDSVWCGCNQIVGNTPVDEPAMFTFLWGYYFGKPRKLK